MLPSFLILFRETLEAALVVGIVLAFLNRTKNSRYNNIVYVGIGAGVFASIIVALVFEKVFGGFEGMHEALFEGIAMLLGAALITTGIFLMMRKRNIAVHIKEKLASDVDKNKRFGIFFLVFISVLREGVEAVLFLASASLVATGNLIGGLLGIGSAILLGYLIFVASIKVDVKKFFNISSFFLILFAAGLVAHGVLELQEAKILPEYVEHVWELNPAAPYADQGIYPVLHEKGSIGGMASSLFGYDGDPSLLMVLSYISYLSISLILYKHLKRTINTFLNLSSERTFFLRLTIPR